MIMSDGKCDHDDHDFDGHDHDDHDCDDHDHDEGGGQYSDHSRMLGRRELQVVVDHSLVVGLV